MFFPPPTGAGRVPIWSEPKRSEERSVPQAEGLGMGGLSDEAKRGKAKPEPKLDEPAPGERGKRKGWYENGISSSSRKRQIRRWEPPPVGGGARVGRELVPSSSERKRGAGGDTNFFLFFLASIFCIQTYSYERASRKFPPAGDKGGTPKAPQGFREWASPQASPRSGASPIYMGMGGGCIVDILLICCEKVVDILLISMVCVVDMLLISMVGVVDML